MRVVLDSNVIVSVMSYPGSEAQVLALAAQRSFDLVLSEFLLAEVQRVLLYKLDWSHDRAAVALAELRDRAIIIDPPRFVSLIGGEHPDNRILECAVHASADYLVTGDRKHLLPIGELEGVRIVRAPEFLEILERR